MMDMGTSGGSAHVFNPRARVIKTLWNNRVGWLQQPCAATVLQSAGLDNYHPRIALAVRSIAIAIVGYRNGTLMD